MVQHSSASDKIRFALAKLLLMKILKLVIILPYAEYTQKQITYWLSLRKKISCLVADYLRKLCWRTLSQYENFQSFLLKDTCLYLHLAIQMAGCFQNTSCECTFTLTYLILLFDLAKRQASVGLFYITGYLRGLKEGRIVERVLNEIYAHTVIHFRLNQCLI